MTAADELVQTSLGSGSGSDSFSKSLFATTTLPEITHLRATLSSGTAVWDTGWVHVSDPYPTGTVTLAVNRWAVNTENGRVSYDLVMNGVGLKQEGGPCDGYCEYRVEAWYRDGTIELQRSTLSSGSASGWTFTKTLTATDTALSEITHLKAKIYPSGGASRETYDTGWITVSPPYPTGQTELLINDWDYDALNSKVTYDLVLEAVGTKQQNGPCDGYCSWRIEAWYRDGTTEIRRATLASGSGSGWSFTKSAIATTPVSLGSITHLTASVYPTQGARETYSAGFIPVSGSIHAGVDVDHYATLLGAAWAADPTNFCVPLLRSVINFNASTSTTDDWDACEAARLAGKSLRMILREILIAGGVVSLGLLLNEATADLGEMATEAEADATSAVWSQGLPPENNCIDDPGERQQIEDSLPEQVHHLATNKHTKLWTAKFTKIANRYGLNLDDDWNKVPIAHRGSHPHRYHDWVHRNMLLADLLAKGDKQLFLDLFKSWVEDVVVDDPLIAKLLYWKCRNNGKGQ